MINEIDFQVELDQAGGYVASARLDHGSILTQGDTIDELKIMIDEAIEGYFIETPKERPQAIRLHLDDMVITN